MRQKPLCRKSTAAPTSAYEVALARRHGHGEARFVRVFRFVLRGSDAIGANSRCALDDLYLLSYTPPYAILKRSLDAYAHSLLTSQRISF